MRQVESGVHIKKITLILLLETHREHFLTTELAGKDRLHSVVIHDSYWKKIKMEIS